MLRILATYNIKGGVGKTTAAVNLAYLAALDGHRTLLWDLDPQGGASFCLSMKGRIKGGSRGLIRGKRELLDVIRPTVYEGLDLLPADRSYRNMDLHLDARRKPERRLLKMMRPLSGEYDLLLMDCAPSISLVADNVFRAADALLMPVIPNPLAMRAIPQVRSYLKRNRLTDVVLLPFFSMVDRRKRMHREFIESPPRDLVEFMQAYIPYSSDIEKMSLRREPLVSYSPASWAGQSFIALWEEMEQGLQLSA